MRSSRAGCTFKNMPETTRQIILASESRQRKAMLDTLHLPYLQVPAQIDESAISADSEEKRCELIARAKAEAVAEEYPEGIIIAADTYSVADGKAFEKPANKEEAKAMLRALSGKVNTTITGFCFIDRNNSIDESMTVVTQYTFRDLSDNEIDRYVAHNPVTTWSAAFSPAYDSGMALIESVDGPITSFTHGLPLEKVVHFLKKSGVAV